MRPRMWVEERRAEVGVRWGEDEEREKEPSVKSQGGVEGGAQGSRGEKREKEKSRKET